MARSKSLSGCFRLDVAPTLGPLLLLHTSSPSSVPGACEVAFSVTSSPRVGEWKIRSAGEATSGKFLNCPRHGSDGAVVLTCYRHSQWQDSLTSSDVREMPAQPNSRYTETLMGSLQTGRRVAAKIAFAIAGAIGGTLASPTPPGASLLRTMCTSIFGISPMRSMS